MDVVATGACGVARFAKEARYTLIMIRVGSWNYRGSWDSLAVFNNKFVLVFVTLLRFLISKLTKTKTPSISSRGWSGIRTGMRDVSS